MYGCNVDCYDSARLMLDGLYQYRLGNVGWAVSI